MAEHAIEVMPDRPRLPTPGETWQHRRTGRQVEVLTVPNTVYYGGRVEVQGRRRSEMLLTAFLRDYAPLEGT